MRITTKKADHSGQIESRDPICVQVDVEGERVGGSLKARRGSLTQPGPGSTYNIQEYYQFRWHV